MDELSSTNERIEILRQDIAEVKQISIENRDALLGKIGSPGVITNLALMNEKMGTMEKLTSNHLAHMAEKMDLMLSWRDKLQLEKDSTQVNWLDIIKDWIKPIITGIVMAIILAILARSGVID